MQGGFMETARKRANVKWDKANMATLTCRVTKEKAQRFKDACDRLGTNRNAEFLKTINRIIEEAESRG